MRIFYYVIVASALFGAQLSVAKPVKQKDGRHPNSYIQPEFAISGAKAKSLFEELEKKIGYVGQYDSCSTPWQAIYMDCSASKCSVLGYDFQSGKLSAFESDRDPVVSAFKAAGVKLKKGWTDGGRFINVSCSIPRPREDKNCDMDAVPVCEIEKVLAPN